jgi:hypothetical protein
MKHWLSIMALCLSAISASAAPNAATGKAMLQKASASFSAIPFDTPKRKVKVKLTVIEGENCETMGECTYIDAMGVEYYFWDVKHYLVIKSISAKRFVGKEIKALGIGIARDRQAVMANVKAFLPKAEVYCREANDAGEGEGISSCGAMLGEGWFKILFDANNQLIEARVDAYEFT